MTIACILAYLIVGACVVGVMAAKFDPFFLSSSEAPFLGLATLLWPFVLAVCLIGFAATIAGRMCRRP